MLKTSTGRSYDVGPDGRPYRNAQGAVCTKSEYDALLATSKARASAPRPVNRAQARREQLAREIETLPESVRGFARDKLSKNINVVTALQAAIAEGEVEGRRAVRDAIRGNRDPLAALDALAAQTAPPKAPRPAAATGPDRDTVHGHALRLGISDEQARRYLAGEGA